MHIDRSIYKRFADRVSRRFGPLMAYKMQFLLEEAELSVLHDDLIELEKRVASRNEAQKKIEGVFNGLEARKEV